MSFEEFQSLCEKRHSVRMFANDPIDEQDLLDCIKIASLAPSVENTQPWHFHIIKNTDMKNAVLQDSCYGNFSVGAGSLIVVTCDKQAKPSNQDLVWNPKEIEYSCVSAVENLLLAATSKGLGSCWVSLHHGPVHDTMKLKDHEAIIGAIIIGNVSESDAARLKAHERKPFEQTYTIHD